jgi:hypothetical protein
VSAVFLVGGVGVFRSAVFGENLISEGDHHWQRARGCRSQGWRRCGGFQVQMMVTYASSAPWGIIFGDIPQLYGRVNVFVGGRAAVSACFSCGDQGGVAWHLPSTTTSLGGSHVTIDTHKEEALSVIDGGKMKFMRIFTKSMIKRDKTITKWLNGVLNGVSNFLVAFAKRCTYLCLLFCRSLVGPYANN